MSEPTEQDQTTATATVETGTAEAQASLEDVQAKIAELEGKTSEKDSRITKLEQEKASLEKILIDRGVSPQNQRPQQAQQQAQSELDREIAALEAKASSGEISAEDLSARSLQLIRRAKQEGMQEAVAQVTNMYNEQQQITSAFNSIFATEELKGMNDHLGNIAYGYMQQAMSSGYTAQQAAEYAKSQTVQALRNIRGNKEEPKKQEPVKKATGLTGEGEGAQVQQKQKPVSASASQASFIEQRRKALMTKQGYTV